ncbi:uncharacterized protein J8A68_002953 [[Candida] subhashii]|uniref:Mitochondrial group I intron splicing factor CCM1 n=1 Tax=[Candida] subhashii TaxID=561895 RepID=A0A8J5QBS6_9ASCO|nr:uncharacterized protein J8A68_002953 [[Candida] subhashii]KAG7663494.1 hypothetical protein J8A68_002953 [[Candida] subhashii]
MLPLRQTISRTLPRRVLIQIAKPTSAFYRFQSTITSNNQSQQPIPEKVTHDPKITNPDNNNSDLVADEGAGNEVKGERSYYIHPILKEIGDQVSQAIKSSSKDLTEAYEVFEEGITYIREIHTKERIGQAAVGEVYLPLARDLLIKALEPGATLGTKSLEDLLTVFETNKIAHSTQYSRIAAHYLKEGESLETYSKILQLWIRFLEIKGVSTIFFDENRIDPVYGHRVLSVLTQYAFALACIEEGSEYTIDRAMKLLQRDTVNSLWHMRNVLQTLGLFNEETFKRYAAVDADQQKANFDPNTRQFHRRIDEAIQKDDRADMNKMFRFIQEVSSKYKTAIDEKTTTKLMEGFFHLEDHTQVFNIFQVLLKSCPKPPLEAWNILLKSFSTPKEIAKAQNDQEKKQFLQKFNRLVETVKSQYKKLTPDTYASIISGYSNFGKFDEVDKYVEEQKASGLSGMNNIAKDGYLVGLLHNNKINEAETKLGEFTSDRSGYVPGILVMNSFLAHYSNAQNYKAVDGILAFMQKHKIPENAYTLTTVVDRYLKQMYEKGLSPDMNEVFKLIESAKLPRLPGAMFTSILKGLADNHNATGARELYSLLSKEYPNDAGLITAMLATELQLGDTRHADRIFQEAKEKFRDSSRIYNQMIRACLDKDERLAWAYYEAFKNEKTIKPNKYTYFFLLDRAFGKRDEKNIERILADLEANPLKDYGHLPRLFSKLIQLGYRLPPSVMQTIEKGAM